MNFKKTVVMAVIETKSSFEFSCKTPNYKSIWCALPNGENVKANFNCLQISFNGTVKVLIERKIPTNKKEFVTLKQILSQHDSDNEYIFGFMSKEFDHISQKRKSELKKLQKTRKKFIPTL